MKILIIVIPLLYSCASIAVDKTPPQGEMIYDILLSIRDVRLNNEPLCRVVSTTRNAENLTFGNHLSTIFSTSYNSSTINTIKSSCALSKHEESNKITDIWDCKFEIAESSKEGEFISSSMVAFGVNAKSLNYQPGTLRCF